MAGQVLAAVYSERKTKTLLGLGFLVKAKEASVLVDLPTAINL
jgi:hypothetical protein